MSPQATGRAAGRRLVVYSRQGCHLCEEMVEGLRRLQAAQPLDFAVVDVDETPELAARYGDSVPVLAVDDVIVCRYRLDEGALMRHLGAGP